MTITKGAPTFHSTDALAKYGKGGAQAIMTHIRFDNYISNCLQIAATVFAYNTKELRIITDSYAGFV